MKTYFTPFGNASLWLLFILCLLIPDFVAAQVSMSRDVTEYEQNFDALPVSDSVIWENGTEFPAIPGWYIQRTKTTNSLVASDGQGNTGGLFSYGKKNTTERALGAMSSLKKGEFAWGLLLQNNTGDTITQLNVKFYGEQWRISNKVAPQHQIAFFYAVSDDPSSFNLSPKSDKGWTPDSLLNFKGPRFGTEGGKLNGNAAENRQLLSGSIPVSIPDGAYVMLRWKDADELEPDHGLAIDDFSMSWTVKSRIILPVKLVSFTAKPSGNNVELAWQTATEEQNSFFEVERSPNGGQFKSLGKVSGNGTTAVRSNYTFLDAAPLPGTSYYRLKQVDEDGTYTYSAVVRSTSIATAAIKALAYPTVTSHWLHIVLEGDYTIQQALIIDMSGRQVLTQQWSGNKALSPIDVSTLRSGSYLLVLLDEKGQRFTNRFIKR